MMGLQQCQAWKTLRTPTLPLSLGQIRSSACSGGLQGPTSLESRARGSSHHNGMTSMGWLQEKDQQQLPQKGSGTAGQQPEELLPPITRNLGWQSLGELLCQGEWGRSHYALEMMFCLHPRSLVLVTTGSLGS